MPKTKTTTSRSSAKNKRKGLLSKINFSSRKTQLVIIVASFAIIGGAWFTYKSFAATNLVSYQAGTLGYGVVEDRTAKKGYNVARLQPGQGVSFQIEPNGLKNYYNYKVVATARKESDSTTSKLQIEVKQLTGAFTSGYNRTTTQYVSGSSYPNYVSLQSVAFTGWGRDAAKITVWNRGPYTVRIGTITVQQL